MELGESDCQDFKSRHFFSCWRLGSGCGRLFVWALSTMLPSCIVSNESRETIMDNLLVGRKARHGRGVVSRTKSMSQVSDVHEGRVATLRTLSLRPVIFEVQQLGSFRRCRFCNVELTQALPVLRTRTSVPLCTARGRGRICCPLLRELAFR